MRSFIFRVEIEEGCDENWEDLAELPLMEAAECLRQEVEEYLRSGGYIYVGVTHIGARNDASA